MGKVARSSPSRWRRAFTIPAAATVASSCGFRSVQASRSSAARARIRLALPVIPRPGTLSGCAVRARDRGWGTLVPAVVAPRVVRGSTACVHRPCASPGSTTAPIAQAGEDPWRVSAALDRAEGGDWAAPVRPLHCVHQEGIPGRVRTRRRRVGRPRRSSGRATWQRPMTRRDQAFGVSWRPTPVRCHTQRRMSGGVIATSRLPPIDAGTHARARGDHPNPGKIPQPQRVPGADGVQRRAGQPRTRGRQHTRAPSKGERDDAAPGSAARRAATWESWLGSCLHAPGERVAARDAATAVRRSNLGPLPAGDAAVPAGCPSAEDGAGRLIHARGPKGSRHVPTHSTAPITDEPRWPG